MSELARTQELFWRAIVHPTSVRDFLSQADEDTRARFAATFAGSDAFSAVDRVEVYAQAYFFRLLDVLATQYPVVQGYLGKDDFHDAVTDFLLVHPSRSPNLHDLGDPFPEFLSAHPAAKAHPFLPGFARVERALAHAIDAAFGHPLAATAVASLPVARWPEFRLVPSAARVEAAWDMRGARRDLREGRPLPAPEPCAATLVWRRGHVPVFRPTTPLEEVLLPLLAGGTSFFALCASTESAGFDAGALSAALQGWLEDELLEATR